MAWFSNHIPTAPNSHAPAGGTVGLDGHYRRGGEFEPFYVPRQDMPQIDEGDLIPLIVHLTKKRVNVRNALVPPDDLLFHQHVFESRIPASTSPDMERPLLVSGDGYVLDGNHRAVAHKRLGTRPPCLIIDADFTEAMALLFSFPRTYTYGEGTANAVNS
jgi:hypothetical protein